jgi:DNA-directed RNA polymerase specialized sigma24 family protein
MLKLADIHVAPEELAAARAGDAAARRALFDKVAAPTLAIVRRLVRHAALADDLTQDTLIAMYEHLDDFRGEAPFGIWVRSIAVSRCLTPGSTRARRIPSRPKRRPRTSSISIARSRSCRR